MAFENHHAPGPMSISASTPAAQQLAGDGPPSAPPATQPWWQNRQSLIIALVSAAVAVAALLAALASGSTAPPKDAAAARKVLADFDRLAAAGDVTGACKLATDASYQNAQRGPYGSCERFLISSLQNCGCANNAATVLTMDVHGSYATATWSWNGNPADVFPSVLEWDSREGWRIDIS